MQVQALDSLAKALHVEVLELRRERARALSSRGLWGHLKNLLGYLLSAYCLFKYAASAECLHESSADSLGAGSTPPFPPHPRPAPSVELIAYSQLFIT